MGANQRLDTMYKLYDEFSTIGNENSAPLVTIVNILGNLKLYDDMIAWAKKVHVSVSVTNNTKVDRNSFRFLRNQFKVNLTKAVQEGNEKV